jgi:hypothetical protein
VCFHTRSRIVVSRPNLERGVCLIALSSVLCGLKVVENGQYFVTRSRLVLQGSHITQMTYLLETFTRYVIDFVTFMSLMFHSVKISPHNAPLILLSHTVFLLHIGLVIL